MNAPAQVESCRVSPSPMAQSAHTTAMACQLCQLYERRSQNQRLSTTNSSRAATTGATWPGGRPEVSSPQTGWIRKIR